MDSYNATNISAIFYGCKSLVSLPDISKWNTSKVTNINRVFYECCSFISLPDISIWDLLNIKNMDNLFSGCKSLKTLHNLSKWKSYILNLNDILTFLVNVNNPYHHYQIFQNAILQMLLICLVFFMDIIP